jgi:hypothetical protein
MRLYVPADLRDRVRARVVVKDCEREVGVPFRSWTFPSTVYDIREPWSHWRPLVGADGVFVAGGDAFFLTLGSDLPPGPCEILVTLDTGATATSLRHGSGAESAPRDGSPREMAYLQVSQVVAGRRDVRRVFAETGATAAGEIHE